MIEVIFSDIDGCFVPEGYDPLGVIQTEGTSEHYFKYYRHYSGPQLVLCTGRAWENTSGILRRADYMPNQRTAWPDRPVLCENGIVVIVDPVNGEWTSLVDELEEMDHLKSLIKPISNIGGMLENHMEEMRQELERVFGRNVTPISLARKEFMVTVRRPFFEGTAEPVGQTLFFQTVTHAVQEPLGSLLGDGSVRLVQSSSAVDITLPISKGDGVRYLLEKYSTSPSRAAYIGDSAPDIEGMKQVGLACCPANAVPSVKAYVASLGKRGYVSPLMFADAEIDILNHIQSTQS